MGPPHASFVTISILVLSTVYYVTGGSAKAAGDLVAKAGGKTLEYIFVIRASSLKGWEKLDAPSYGLIDIEN